MLFRSNGTEYTTFAAYKAGSGKDVNSYFENPSYINAGVGNLHLSTSSILINYGDPAFVAASGETDIDGENRIIGSRVEVGADEVFVSNLMFLNNNKIETKLNIYPNPASSFVTITNTKGIDFEIRDTNGKLMLTKSIQNKEDFSVIDLEVFPKGLYFINWKNDVEFGSEKMVVN